MKRYLKRQGVALLCMLLVSFFFTTSCKKDLELKKEDSKVSAITFDEAKAYVKSKERELPFVPNWAKSQYTVTKDNYIVRAPLKGTHGTLYLFKDRKGTIKGSVFRLFYADSSQRSSNYTGMIIRYDIEDQQLQGLEMKNGASVKNITYESQRTTTVSKDKATENIFERIWCWLSGDVYNGTSCIKAVREDPTSNDEGGSGGGGGFFEKTEDIPTSVVVSQDNGYKSPVSWSSGSSSGGSSGPIDNEEYWDGTGWETPGQLTWDDYYDMPYEGAVWIMNNLKNEVTGEAVELYLMACYKEGKIINLSAFGNGNMISKTGDYYLSPRYDMTGKLLFYAAYRNEQNGIEYIIKADAIQDFVNGADYYTKKANQLYSGGTPSIDKVASELTASTTFYDQSKGYTYTAAEIENFYTNNPSIVDVLENHAAGDDPTLNLSLVTGKYFIAQTVSVEREAQALKILHPNWSKVYVYIVATKRVLSDDIHFMLDIAGMIPVVGEPADIINGGIYFLEGDKINCALSVGAAVPFVGWTATAGKWTKNTVKAMTTTVSNIPNLNKAYKAIKTGKTVRFIKVTINSFSHTGLKALEAVKPADAKLTSIGRWLLDQSAMRIAPTETALKNIVDDIVKNGDNVVNAGGKKTEALCDLIFAREGFTKYTSKLASDNGFDGIFIKGTLDNPTEIIINEAKQVSSAGSIALGETVSKGTQMSDTWINATIQEMRDHTDAATKQLGNILFNNKAKITKTVTGVDRSTGEILILKLKNYN